jgi:hypothetical protein
MGLKVAAMPSGRKLTPFLATPVQVRAKHQAYHCIISDSELLLFPTVDDYKLVTSIQIILF